MTDLASNASQRSLLEILLGGSFVGIDLDLQYNIVSNPRKNTLTASGTDKEDAGSAFLALITYKLNDDLKFGFRFENISKDPRAGNYPEAQTLGAVVHYKVQEGAMLRAEWNDTHVNRSTASAVYSESRWDIGTVIQF